MKPSRKKRREIARRARITRELTRRRLAILKFNVFLDTATERMSTIDKDVKRLRLVQKIAHFGELYGMGPNEILRLLSNG